MNNGRDDARPTYPCALTDAMWEVVSVICRRVTREGRAVSREALARRIRRNGHTIRNNRVSELLAAPRQEAPPVNGHRPPASVNGHRPTPSA